MQVITPPKVYPVIIIGSGASGGMAAWNLTRQGIEVVLLDAGDKFDRAKYWTHVTPWESQARLARGEKPETFFLDTKEQPYLTPNERPFELTRVWGHGGKTNVWGRVSLRYSDIDFKAAERDGWEIPWPISYKDIAPYYDQVEQLIGVNGGTDDSDVAPRQQIPAAAARASVRRTAAATSDGEAEYPRRRRSSRQYDAPDARLSRVSLLRQLRQRVRHGLVLLLGRSPAAVCAADRQVGTALERGGRADPDRRERTRIGRAVLRSPHRLRTAGARQGRRPGRELRRFDAHSAELEIFDAPERSRQRIRCDRPLPLRTDPAERARISARARRDGDAERSRHRRRTHLYAAIQPSVRPRSRLPAWIRRAILEHVVELERPHGGSDQIPGFGASLKKQIKRRHPAWFEIHPFGEALPYAHNRITVDPTARRSIRRAAAAHRLPRSARTSGR